MGRPLRRTRVTASAEGCRFQRGSLPIAHGISFLFVTCKTSNRLETRNAKELGPRCVTTPGPLLSVQRDEGLCSPVLSLRRRSYHNRGRVSQTTPLCVCVDNFFAAAPKPLPYWAYRRPAPCQIKQFLRLRR